MVISLVDPASRDTSELVSTPIPNLPNKAQLKKSIEAFKNSLELTNDEIRELERKTREENKEILPSGLLLDDFKLQLLYLVILFIEDQQLPLIIW